MLGSMSASVHAELMAFFANLDNCAALLVEVSKQFFPQSRQKFSARTFQLINHQLLADLDEPDLHWHGYRLVAADASALSLCSRALLNRSTPINAAAFLLYLPQHELTLEFELYSTSVSEHQMLFEHLAALRSDDLLLLNLGYPCRWLAAVLGQCGQPFCMRVDECGFAASRIWLAPTRREAGDYGCSCTPTTVRLIKTRSVDGVVRVVMTNLLDAERYPSAQFNDL
ncbi:hypothetical protein ACTSKR_10895 [Chitinibacteraceae bacterium HSL-7]